MGSEDQIEDSKIRKSQDLEKRSKKHKKNKSKKNKKLVDSSGNSMEENSLEAVYKEQNTLDTSLKEQSPEVLDHNEDQVVDQIVDQIDERRGEDPEKSSK